MNLLLVFLALFGTPAQAQTITYSTSTAELIIRATAAHYGVSGEEVFQTLKCESNLSESIVGDHGTSYGVAQIHLPAHPDISKAEALDPLFSINYAASQFSKGHASMWSCYRKLYGSSEV